MACSNRLTTDDGTGTIASPTCIASAAILSRCAATLYTWFERARQRHALRRLDDRLLRDIGVTRAAAQREAATPFWRSGASRGRKPVLRPGAALRFPIYSRERRRG